jgi:hypothetical protein
VRFRAESETARKTKAARCGWRELATVPDRSTPARNRRSSAPGTSGFPAGAQATEPEARVSRAAVTALKNVQCGGTTTTQPGTIFKGSRGQLFWRVVGSKHKNRATETRRRPRAVWSIGALVFEFDSEPGFRAPDFETRISALRRPHPLIVDSETASPAAAPQSLEGCRTRARPIRRSP